MHTRVCIPGYNFVHQALSNKSAVKIFLMNVPELLDRIGLLPLNQASELSNQTRFRPREGGFSIVRAYQSKENPNQIVAVKQPTKKGSNIEKELKILQHCIHLRGIVQLQVLGENPGYLLDNSRILCLLMQWVDHIEFSSAVRMQCWPTGISSKCFRSLLVAVAGLHWRGIVHGDIKISNILIRKGSVVLTDFGMAAHDLEGLTKYGTTGFKAPETAINNVVFKGLYATKLDLWAVGVCGLLFGMARTYVVSEVDISFNTSARNWKLPSQEDILPSSNRSLLQDQKLAESSRNSPVGWARELAKNRALPSRLTQDDLLFECVEALLSWDPRQRPSAFSALTSFR